MFDPTLRGLLSQVEMDKVGLPAMQRPFVWNEDRTAVMTRLDAMSLPALDVAQVTHLRSALVRRAGLAQLQRDLEDEIRHRLPPPPAPAGVGGGGAAREVASVAWPDLQPPDLLTNEAELDDWLRRLRTRLSSLLRSGKHIRLE